MIFPNSKHSQNVPHGSFGTAISAPRDQNTQSKYYDRGIIYKPNGTGRDTYIYNDDGGFNKMY